MRERLCVWLLRLTAAIEEWVWARYQTPEIPTLSPVETPTQKLAYLRAHHRAFHSVRLVGRRVWRVRLHCPNGTVYAATASTIDAAIESLAARLEKA